MLFCKASQKVFQLIHILWGYIDKARSTSIIPALLQMNVYPNYLHKRFDEIQIRAASKKEFQFQILTSLQLFRKINHQPPFAGIDRVARVADGRVDLIVFYRQIH